MQVHHHFPLKNYNSFAIAVKARAFVELSSLAELGQLMKLPEYADYPRLIISGGSNVLFTKDFQGLVIHVNLKGFNVEKQNEDFVWVRSFAGEDWESLVEYAVDNQWAGLENLTLIPGKVGTSPMQNIGAYGVEVKDCFDQLDAWDMQTGEIVTFTKEQCNFGYRESIFKNQEKGRYIIISVRFRLRKRGHKLNLDYGPVRTMLEQLNVKQPTISDVMEAIRQIRRSKLPDPKQLGNAGSFFKNPMLAPSHYVKLKENYPDIPGYNDTSGKIKTPAAWLIEQAGWKGFREKDAGVHTQQALVLVNYGQATGREILDLAERIQKDVMLKYGISLEREVNVV